MVALPEACPAITSSLRASGHPESLHNRVVDLLRGGLTPKACRLWLKRDNSHSGDQASSVVRKASAILKGCDGHTSRARQLEILTADLRAGSTPASCSASLVREKELSRSQAKRLVRTAAANLGIHSVASNRSRAVADTIEHLLAGSSLNECRVLLKQDHGWTPKQLKTILHKARVGADQQEIHEESVRAQWADEAKEYDDNVKALEAATAAHLLDLV